VRVLLDECMPRRLKRELIGHECQTVPEAGFSGKKNGELLELAEASAIHGGVSTPILKAMFPFVT